jgi:hypothetical protein
MDYERMPNRYQTENDLSARLHGTICRYKDQPVYVYVDGKNLHLKHPVTRIDIIQIKWDDPDFDISSPELGYFNLLTLSDRSPKNRVFYAERQPVKKWRQGLNPNVLHYSDIEGDPDKSHIPGMPQDHWLADQGFYDMLTNEYPSLNKAFDILEAETFSTKYGIYSCKEIAISKDTAIQKTKSGVYQVFYKCDNVGWVAPGTRTVNVKSSEMGWIISKFLKEFNWRVE